MLKKITQFIVFCSIATTAAIQAEDVAVHVDSEMHEDKGVEETATAVYISGEDVKVETENNSGYFIFKGGENLVWFVDEEKETYTEVDEELIANLKSYLEKMRKRLEQLPAAQRQMAKSMMQQQMDRLKVSLEEEENDLEYNLTDQKKDINDYPCRELEILKDSVKTGDIWFTDWDNIEYQQELKSAYTAMLEFLNSVRSIVDESLLNNYGQMPFVRCDVSEEMEGMPVSAIHYDDNGNVVNKSRLQKIEAVDLADDTFLPPEGYEREKPEIPE